MNAQELLAAFAAATDKAAFIASLSEKDKTALLEATAALSAARKETTKDLNAKIAKDRADKKAEKRKALLGLCVEAGIPCSTLAKSLHNTDRSVKGVLGSTLVGVKVRINGISGSFDTYVPAIGKKTKKRDEEAIKQAQVDILRILNVAEDAGFTTGDEEECDDDALAED